MNQKQSNANHKRFIGLLFTALFAFSTSGCDQIRSFVAAGPSGTSMNERVTSIAPNEAYGMSRNGFAKIIDVREASETANGMAQGAVSLPTSSVESEDETYKTVLSSLKKNEELVFYCAAGIRADVVAKKFAAMGYKTRNMGGYNDWVTAGLPTETPKPKGP